MTSLQPLPATTPEIQEGLANFVKYKNLYGMYHGQECDNIGLALPQPEHLVNGLIQPSSVNVLVGDSGIGKSPMAYQLALAIATGRPFLGLATRASHVMFADYENNLTDVDWILRQQTKHLGIERIPNNFLLWPLSRDPLQKEVDAIIRAFKPDFVVIDSLRAFKPEMEADNRRALDAIRRMRQIAAESGTAFLLIHHLRRHLSKHAVTDTSDLESGRALDWLRRASGVRAIINQTDVRLAIARRNATSGDLVMSGHFRTRGDVGPYLIRRVFDEEGDPTGYERYEREGAAKALLEDPEQDAVFTRLPREFSFQQAQFALGKAPEMANRLLHKLQRLGLLEKVTRGKYRKIGEEELSATAS